MKRQDDLQAFFARAEAELAPLKMDDAWRARILRKMKGEQVNMKKLTCALLAALMLMLLTAGVGITLSMDLSADVLDLPESIVEIKDGKALIPAGGDFPEGTLTLADAYFNGDVLLLGWQLEFQANDVVRKAEGRVRHTDAAGEKALAWYPDMQGETKPWYASRFYLEPGQLVWGNQQWTDHEWLENTQYMWTPGQEADMVSPLYVWDAESQAAGPEYHLYLITDESAKNADEMVVYLPINRCEGRIARFDGEGYFTLDRKDFPDESVFVKIIIPRS